MKTQTLCKPNSLKAWLLATRPKTFTATIVPVLVGTILARTTGHQVNWGLMFIGLVSAICIQIGMHFINDALDFKKGTDTSERLGPLRVTQKGLLPMNKVYNMGLFFLAFALILSLPLIPKAGFEFYSIICVCALCGYCYTGGPFPIAYIGLGELFVFFFYGIACTSMMYYLQTGTIDVLSILAGAEIGLLATVILAINYMRDFREDAKAHKRTLTVRFGITFSRGLIAIYALLPFLLNIYWYKLGYVLAACLPFISLPLAITIVRQVWKTEPGVLYNKFFGLSALLHFSFGLFLALGLYLQ